MKRALLTPAVVALVAAGLAASSTSANSDTGPEMEFLNADPSSGAPYSDAVRVGNTLYLAGNLGLDASGELVPGGITPESTQTMENLKAVLERNGSSLAQVAECEVMLADIAERSAFNEVYAEYFEPGRFPARHAFGVTGLYAGARVEIACVAVTG